MRPQFSIQDAVRLARELYGLEATAVSLPSDRDQNFRLTAVSGSQFVLKIAAANEERDVLDLQNAAIAHLRRRESLAPCLPDVIPTLDGQPIAKVADADGRAYLVRLVTYLPGVPLAHVNPHTPDLLRDFGRFLGEVDAALQDFRHPAMDRYLHWDMRHAADTITRHLDYQTDPDRRALVARYLAEFEANAAPRLPQLRRSVIHSDGNDYNVLVTADMKQPRRIAGLIDFGDMVYSCTVFDLAIAAAYVMLDKADPLAAAGHLAAGYHAALPLTELELELLYPLILMRLCTSVVMSAYQQTLHPDDPYMVISQKPAWALLEKLADVPLDLAHYRLRAACDLPPVPQTAVIAHWLSTYQSSFAPVMAGLDRARVLDLSVGSQEMGSPADFNDAPKLARRIQQLLDEAGAAVGIGRYDEPRLIYTADFFRTASGERRTIHIGLDLFAAAGTAVYAPLTGVIHSVADNAVPQDYGPNLILAHQTDDGETFYTLYGHLSRASLAGCRVGQIVYEGEPIAALGDMAENGGWPPHLHFQVIVNLLGLDGDFPGVAPASQRDVWRSLCPDPNLIVGLPAHLFPPPELPKAEILQRRRSHMGKSLSISYREPLKIVRGWRQYLYDEVGRPYLDVVNNVCHVGHSHPRVVKALSDQAYVLNTNTRYLHEAIIDYAERLLATLPPPLEVVFLVCSGSEANELALRLARTHTGAQDVIVVDGAYHGNTQALIDISPYKHDGPGGRGAPPHIHKALMPDPYRGVYKGYGRETGRAYAQHVAAIVEELNRRERGGTRKTSASSAPAAVKPAPLAGFIVESVLGCGGQIVLPEGYLAEAFTAVRAAGGVCIADEVQVGFGRVGSHFWGFETQGVVPDIVTMGKPIGNGHPLAAVATTRAIADSFANGMEYFNTFGGNPVSCAVGTAVLEVIHDEKLMQNARSVGGHLLARLAALPDKHRLVGDVRGLGLFIGIELVRDRQTLEPAAAEASYIVERMKAAGILLSIDGPLHNVLKLKPPLVFDHDDADFLVETLDRILGEDAAQP
ncbi:MAG: aminotransferase class III-fold pyridoxal phosphate-dependent enzyme [Chloroflexi bacterium]|nr:aminotransferase class III-fold pyridoxal phosphate-dependent enzyme [Chloroflexota bacterium]